MDSVNSNWSKKRIQYIIASVILFLVGIILYMNVNQSTSDINPHKVKKITNLIIAKKPFIQERKGLGAAKWIEFECKGYSKKFEISNFEYLCSDKGNILSLDINDTISVYLLKNDVNKINKETSFSKANTVHSLFYKKKKLIDIQCRNKLKKRDNYLAYLLCFILFPLTLSVGFFKESPHFFGRPFNPTFFLVLIGLISIFLLNKFL